MIYLTSIPGCLTMNLTVTQRIRTILNTMRHFYTDIPLDKVNDADTMDEILKFNDVLKAFATEYLTLVEDLIKVKNVYEPFLELLHSQSKYLDNNETAKVYSDFMEQTKGKLYPYEKLKTYLALSQFHTQS